MDLGTVKKNLLKGKYSELDELVSDPSLIWENCRTYNAPESYISQLATKLEKRQKAVIDKAKK